MKKLIIFFALILSISSELIFAQEDEINHKYRIDGKSYDKQIFDNNNNQIT